MPPDRHANPGGSDTLISPLPVMTPGEESTQSIDVRDLFSPTLVIAAESDLSVLATTSFGKLIQAIPVPTLLVDGSGRILFANDACGDIEPTGSETEIFFYSLFPEGSVANRARLLPGQVVATGETRVWEAPLSLGDRRVWGRLHFRSIRMGSQRVALTIIEDLTAQKKQHLTDLKHREELRQANDSLERRVRERTAKLTQMNERLRREIAEREKAHQHLKLAAGIISSTNEGIVVTNAQGKIIEVNQAFCRIMGRDKSEAIGRIFEVFDMPRGTGPPRRNVWREIEERGQFYGEMWTRRANGESFPILLSMNRLTDAGPEGPHYVGCFSEITEIKRTEERLNKLAHYDSLTGLTNRLLFRDRLKQAVARAGRNGLLVGLVLVDLDGFKDINDTMGHRFGDKVLITVSERLKKRIRRSDTVSRWGGDEFALILPDMRDGQSVAKVARDVLKELSRPVVLDGQEVFIGASAGIALYPQDGTKAGRLVQKADTALYHAKADGKNRFRFYSPEMNAFFLRRIKMESILRTAMSNGQLTLHYQPMVEITTGKTIGVEALLRIAHPGKGVMSAGKLIPVAETTGLIVPLGEWILKSACEQNRIWQEMGLPLIKVAVNVSGRQLKEPGVAAGFLRILEEIELEPHNLEIELTESVMIEKGDGAAKVLEELREAGISISLDDFGRGFSSLGYLKDLPIDKIKIDRSFLSGVSNTSYEGALVRAVLMVAHSRNLQVVAEGVETEEQLRFLKSVGCDHAQGFLLAEPVAASDIAEALRGCESVLRQGS